jgi:hypothetical protein
LPIAMVDSALQRKRFVAESTATANRAIGASVVRAITQFHNAVGRGDMARAREYFPNMSEREQQYWQNYLEKNELRIGVDPPSNIALSSHDSVADVDVVLRVRYTDKSTKSSTTSPPLRRHATLTKQGTRWQLTALSGP